MLVFQSTIWGDDKHNIVYDVDSSHNNIGSDRMKNLILGTNVPVLVFQSTIWGDNKHNIVYDVGSSHNNIGSDTMKKSDIGN